MLSKLLLFTLSSIYLNNNKFICYGSGIDTSSPTEEPTEEPTQEPTEEFDVITIELEPTSFTGVYDPSIILVNDEDDPPFEVNDTITVDDIYEDSQLLQVFSNGSQFLTIHSKSFLQFYVDIMNDYNYPPESVPDDDNVSEFDDESNEPSSINNPFDGCDIDQEYNDDPEQFFIDNNIDDEIGTQGRRLARRLLSHCPQSQIDGCTVPIWGDTRDEITVNPVTAHVDKHTGMLKDKDTDCSHCSGVLIGSKHVLTAGHCVHSGKNGDWFKSSTMRFYPRRTSITYEQEAEEVYQIDYFWSFKGWAGNGKSDWDIAVVVLKDSPNLGRAIFGYNNGLRKGRNMYHRGYPCDKYINKHGSMWTANYPLHNPKKYRLRFKKGWDVTQGNSGGPIYAYQGENNKVIYGVNTEYVVNNYVFWTERRKDGARIDKYRFDTFCDWTGLNC